MGRFQGFYTGGDVAEENTSYSETEFFAKRRHKQENGRVSTRQMKIWQCDLDKCVTLSDYQNYVKKYNSSDNPCISEANQKIDDLTFANCKSIADYNNYLSLFPSGKNVIKAKAAIRRHQANTSTNTSTKTTTNTTTNSTIRANTYSSHSSNITGDEVWGFIKKAIGVIVILIGIGLVYARVTDQISSTSVICGYWFVVCAPVCKWAFDD